MDIWRNKGALFSPQCTSRQFSRTDLLGSIGKIGASSQEERKTMFEQVFKLFNLEGMTLLADREYVGKSWFKFLKKNKIHFVIRMRIGDYFDDVNQVKGLKYQQMLNKCSLM